MRNPRRLRFICAALVLCLCSGRTTAQTLTATWRQIGLAGQRIKTVGVSPAYPADATLFAGHHFDGELYRSFDGGQTWTTSRPAGAGDMNIVRTVFPPTYRTGGADQT